MSKDKEKAIEQWLISFKKDLETSSTDLPTPDPSASSTTSISKSTITTLITLFGSTPSLRIFTDLSTAMDPFLPTQDSSLTSAWNHPKISVCIAHLHALTPLHSTPHHLLTLFWSQLLRPVFLAATKKPIIDAARALFLSFFSSNATREPVTPSSTPRPAPAQIVSEDAVNAFGDTVVICWMSEVERAWAGIADRLDEEMREDKKEDKGSGVAMFKGGMENLESVILGFSIAHPKDVVDLLCKYCHQRERRLHALALLTKTIRQAAVLQSASTSDPFIAVLSQICLHDIHPASVSGALNILTQIIPHSVPRAADRFNELFLILTRVVHWEVLMHIVFKVIAPSLEGVVGEGPVWSVDLEMDEIDKVAWGQTSLMMSISSEGHEEPHLPSSPNHPQPPDTLFLLNASASVRRSVDSFFTILYGTFPLAVLMGLRQAWPDLASYSYQTSLPEDDGIVMEEGFEVLPDPFARVRRRVLDVDSLDISEILYQRVEHILSSHRLHPNAVSVDTVEQEFRMARSQHPQHSSKSAAAADLLAKSMFLRVPKIAASVQVTVDAEGERTVEDVAGEVVTLNRRLRECVLDLTPSGHPGAYDYSPRHRVQYPVLDLVRLHQLLLMNEINLECSLRHAFLESVMMLRKQIEMNDALSLDRESVYQKLKQQQHELGNLTATVDQLRVEANNTRERYRKYEEDFNRRVRAARDGAKEAREELVEARSAITSLEDRIRELEKDREDGFRRISELENEQLVTAPRLMRLTEYEQTVKSLTEQLSRFSNFETSTRLFELQLLEADRELGAVREALDEKERVLEELATKVALYEQQIEEQGKTIKEQERIVSSVRSNAASRIDIVEEKCRTLKLINKGLEDRILELESELESATLARQ
ncbi:hypothetical protein BC829DRAFT_394045 [Chytridium lagenaria]|nr:hypothetical protein BC829DRAFT_394045 [Chytridium lagenaria]